MMLALDVLCLVTLCLIIETGRRHRKNSSARRGAVVEKAGADSGVDLSEYYRPMNRLLLEDDFKFLSSQPGITPRLIRQMRADRRRIFRQYLRSLSADFADLTGRLRAIMVNSSHSREDLAASILSARIIFTAAMVVIEMRLVLHASGLYRVSISAQDLTEGLAQLQRELEQFRIQPMVTA